MFGKSYKSEQTSHRKSTFSGKRNIINNNPIDIHLKLNRNRIKTKYKYLLI